MSIDSTFRTSGSELTMPADSTFRTSTSADFKLELIVALLAAALTTGSTSELGKSLTARP